MAINHALRMMTHDVMQRPGDKAVRKVVIEIEAKPVLDKTSAALDTIEHRFKVDARLPKRVSDVYPMLPMADDTVSFQPASPGDPRQAVMFDEGDDDVPAGVNPETGEVIDDDSTGSD